MSAVRTHGSVVIHGHFYQPPREDPWLDLVPLQKGAAPYHDWNERVEAESYRPVVEARILDATGEVRRVMNCLEHMSFNFGPTLLSWMETHRPGTYEAVLAADRVGLARTGHGGAIAMAFHHPILPLSTRRDKRTEIHWGILDFRRRFGRHPEGMWLPETAVDHETLDVLAAEGIRFTIVAPHQLRILPQDGRPGLYRTASGDTITVFPYDGALSHGVAFGEALKDAGRWVDELVEGRAAAREMAPDEADAMEGELS
ncbi:MAG: glycoside hydrolase, partial [Gemmatimonadota bacterium]|nr:glycoside hydrolase [Gemmatimonadota bacterium]